MKNINIREHANVKGVLLWQIADKLGIADSNFSRKLRHELTPEQQQKIIQIIYELSEEE